MFVLFPRYLKNVALNIPPLSLSLSIDSMTHTQEGTCASGRAAAGTKARESLFPVVIAAALTRHGGHGGETAATPTVHGGLRSLIASPGCGRGPHHGAHVPGPAPRSLV